MPVCCHLCLVETTVLALVPRECPLARVGVVNDVQFLQVRSADLRQRCRVLNALNGNSHINIVPSRDEVAESLSDGGDLLRDAVDSDYIPELNVVLSDLLYIVMAEAIDDHLLLCWHLWNEGSDVLVPLLSREGVQTRRDEPGHTSVLYRLDFWLEIEGTHLLLFLCLTEHTTEAGLVGQDRNFAKVVSAVDLVQLRCVRDAADAD